MKIPITQRSRNGKIEARAQKNLFYGDTRLSPVFPIQYQWTFRCRRCLCAWYEGISGKYAATPEDLCVSAMVNDWALTTVDQWCPECWSHWWVKLTNLRWRFWEWLHRKLGTLGMVALLILPLVVLFAGAFYNPLQSYALVCGLLFPLWMWSHPGYRQGYYI